MIVLFALVAGCAAKAPAPEKQVKASLAQPAAREYLNALKAFIL
jgi:hypothetical protein